MKTLIAIPSKNRANIFRTHTYKLVKGYDFKLFVEPQEEEAYSEWKDSLVVLPESNRGLLYAKKYIKEYAEERSYKHVLKLDDDGSNFDVGKAIEVSECILHNYPSVGAVGFRNSTQQYSEVDGLLASVYTVRTNLVCTEGTDIEEDYQQSIYILSKWLHTVTAWMKGMKFDVRGLDGGIESKDVPKYEGVKDYTSNRKKLKDWTKSELDSILGRQVFVLSTPRSGSSMLSSILVKLGIDMWQRFYSADKHNPLWYYEDMARKIVLKEWLTKKWGSLLCGRWVRGVKVPELCKHIDTIIPYVQNPHIIVIRREREDRLASYKRMVKKDTAEEELRDRDIELEKAVYRHNNLPILELTYEGILNHPKEEIEKVAKFLWVPIQEWVEDLVITKK